MQDQTERCPWCDSEITRTTFIEVQNAIREQERQRLSAAEAAVRKELQEKYQGDLETHVRAAVLGAQEEAVKKAAAAALERDALLKRVEDADARMIAAKKQAEDTAATKVGTIIAERDALVRTAVTAAHQEAAKTIGAVSSERDALLKKVQDADARMIAAKKQAEDIAATKVATIIAERDALLKKVQDADARVVAAKKQVEDAAAMKMALIVAERDGLLKKAEDAEEQAVAVKKQAQEETARQVQVALAQAAQQGKNEMADVRAILQKDKDQEMLKQQVAFNREREGYQKKMKDLERQIQKKTSNDLGDGAEIDLYEALREAFPEDRISRVQKGQPGADVLQEVLHKGEVCGRIIYDSKNRQAWQYSFAEKLRKDQLEAKADHAILATTVFPSGKKELCIESDVVVVNPARVIAIAELFRGFLTRMRLLNLSAKAKTGKMNRLYQFITSDPFLQRFQEVETIAQNVLDLDAEEKKSHDKVWKERGRLLVRQKNLMQGIDSEVTGILEGGSEIAAQSA